ncbi:MAG: hypothetical protein KDD42_07035, partial [Bdellovibrionales bacterium]|nr:hypothetical protein [Bdellovibrionales bacterium]
MVNLFRAIAVIVFAAISYFAARDVPLVPEVDRYFFFSANDPQLESDQDIRQMFGAGELLIVAVEGEVSTPQYQKRIAQLSSKLSSLEGVSSVESLSHGPQNYEEVVASPLWSRLLLFEDGGGSNVILMVGGASYSKIVRDVTSVSKQFETPRFRPHISGVPFIIERIGSMLYQDLKVFTCATVCILILLVLYRFRSIRMLAG